MDSRADGVPRLARHAGADAQRNWHWTRTSPAGLLTRLIVLAMAAALTACSSPAATSKPAAGGPAAGGAQAQSASEWAQIVEAAKKEGTVVVQGPPGTDTRDGFSNGFQAKYPEIRVDYAGARGTEMVPKLLTEQQAGQFRSDVVINGTTTQIDLRDANALVPIQPFIGGPDIQPANWLGGKLDYADNDNTFSPVFLTAVKVPLAYNSTMVQPDEVKSYKDLLNPKWRGKISTLDPSGAGAGQATATFFYTTPSLGKEFLRGLYDQGLVLSKDERQILDWAARGQYPIALAASEWTAVEMKKRGVELELMAAEALEESSYITAAFGSVGVFKNNPHPNATKVYLNWLLSKEGQLDASKASGYPSRRTDVSTDHLEPSVLVKPNVQYQENYKEPYIRVKPELLDFLKTITK